MLESASNVSVCVIAAPGKTRFGLRQEIGERQRLEETCGRSARALTASLHTLRVRRTIPVVATRARGAVRSVDARALEAGFRRAGHALHVSRAVRCALAHDLALAAACTRRAGVAQADAALTVLVSGAVHVGVAAVVGAHVSVTVFSRLTSRKGVAVESSQRLSTHKFGPLLARSQR